MPSEVQYLVDHGQTYPVIRLSGILDAETAPVVRSTILAELAGQPQAVVVDVADLHPASPESVRVFLDLRREAADWPATHLVLCGVPGSGTPSNDTPGNDTPDAWRSTGWPVWPDADRAFAGLGAPETGRRFSLDLEPQMGSARLSRELITEACTGWGRPELAGPACIVATEMVNNVVAHAHTSMVVLLAAREDGMTVAVRDRSDVVPAFNGSPVPVTAYGGRGMLLIDSVASRWGNLVLADGKVVWALLVGEELPTQPPGGQRNGVSMPDPARG